MQQPVKASRGWILIGPLWGDHCISKEKKVKRKTFDFFCNIIIIIIIILMITIIINILFIIIIEYYHLSIKTPSSLLFICFVYFSR